MTSIRRTPIRALAAAFALTVALPTIAGAVEERRAASTLAGIDVSHWQGEIDWAQVARAGKRFVFLKATDGLHTVDPTFATNRSGARANGLSVGSYHFARPDGSRGDARREARHFVEVASPGPGDLLPVLDMETSQGLDQEGVTRWARTWARVVRALTGVTPLVYTSPSGWSTRTGDTTLLARDGSELWVAHWGVSSPTLPADGWDGRGWVVWQHTSTGHVRGIDGNVDLDRLSGTRLGIVTIRRLTLHVRGGAGAVISDPAGLGCSRACTFSVDPDARVTLTAVPDRGAGFRGWSGACTGAGLTCTLAMRGSRAVQARFVADGVAPIVSIVPPRGRGAVAQIVFDEPVRGVGAETIVMREAGGRREPVRRVCRAASALRVSCRTTAVRSVALRQASPLVAGRTYEIEVNPTGSDPAVRDRAGNPAATTSARFDAPRS